MAIQSAVELLERRHFKEITESGALVEDMLDRQVCAEQVAAIDGHARLRAGSRKIERIVHIARDAEWFQVFAKEDALSHGQCSEAARRDARERRESTGNLRRAEPAVCRKGQAAIDGEGRSPRIGILHDRPVFEYQVGRPDSSSGCPPVRLGRARTPIDR